MADVRNVLALMVQADVPAVVYGKPGCGKSSFILNQLGSALGCTQTKQHISSIRPAEELIGIPFRSNDGLEYRYLIEKELLAVISDPNALLLIDELTTLNPQQQAGSLAILSERRIGEFKVECRLVGAANPPEQAANGNELAAAMRNRFAHLMFDLPAGSFAKALRNDGQWEYDVPLVPEGWKSGIQDTAEMVADFFGAHPQHEATDPVDDFPGAFPSHRTWTMAVQFLTAAQSVAADTDDIRNGMGGLVGAQPTAAFMDFFKMRRVGVDIDLAFKEPEKFAAKIAKLPMDRQHLAFTAVNDRIASQAVSVERGALVYVASEGILPPDILYPHFQSIKSALGDLAKEVEDILTSAD